ncbi:MAG: hypothetical protein F6K26_44805 [Moorea sp. SIO2I5]|nr:hypothetical protein [Moorena sp. SIO2I5]
MANLILNAEKAPLRSWGGSAVLGVPPMSNCRGNHGAYKVRTQVPHTAPPHSLLHQDKD